MFTHLIHSFDFRELKDHYASADINIDQQDTLPELLRAILEKNPDVFNGTDGRFYYSRLFNFLFKVSANVFKHSIGLIQCCDVTSVKVTNNHQL